MPLPAKDKRVVPVASDLGAEAGCLILGRQLDSIDRRQARRNQPSLQLHRDPVLLLVQLGAANRESDPVGRLA